MSFASKVKVTGSALVAAIQTTVVIMLAFTCSASNRLVLEKNVKF